MEELQVLTSTFWYGAFFLKGSIKAQRDGRILQNGKIMLVSSIMFGITGILALIALYIALHFSFYYKLLIVAVIVIIGDCAYKKANDNEDRAGSIALSNSLYVITAGCCYIFWVAMVIFLF